MNNVNKNFLNVMFRSETDTRNIDYQSKKIIGGDSQDKNVGFDSTDSLYHQHGYSFIYDQLKTSQDLTKRYIDYENMDDDPIISSAFDLYADDATQSDYKKHVSMWAESLDGPLDAGINWFLKNVLKTEENLWEMARSLVKYGNNNEVILHNAKGVTGLDFIAPFLTRRYEFRGGTAFAVNQSGDFKLNDKSVFKALNDNLRVKGTSIIFSNWEMMHMRLRTKNRGSRYGYSMAEGARSVWKRLGILKDASLLYKITRVPNRLVYYVNVGQKTPEESASYVGKQKRRYRKKSFVNPRTGKIEFKQHPLSGQDDIWVPVRDGKDPTRVETLPSVDYQSIDLLNDLRNELFAALKIPRLYLTYDENSNARATVSNEDVRFARTELRIQREIINGIGKVVAVDFALKGKDFRQLDYVLKMAIPSTAFEIAQLEVESTRLSVGQQYLEFAPKEWILTRIFGLSEVDVKRMFTKRLKEKSAEVKSQIDALGNVSSPTGESFENIWNNAKDTREYARMESRLDKKLEEILRNDKIFNSKFENVKKMLKEMKDISIGMKYNDTSLRYNRDRGSSDEFGDVSDYIGDYTS